MTWVVLSAAGDRAGEARRSAKASAQARSERATGARAVSRRLPAGAVRGGQGALRAAEAAGESGRHPDAPPGGSASGPRLAAELTWNTWRDHLIYEYEIPKYEGDLGQPNVYVPLTARAAKRKTSHLERHFSSQRSRTWFRAENFEAVMRLRGLECRSQSGFAEAFHGRKIVF